MEKTTQDLTILKEFLENAPTKVKTTLKNLEKILTQNKENISLNKSFSTIQSDLNFIKESIKENKKKEVISINKSNSPISFSQVVKNNNNSPIF